MGETKLNRVAAYVEPHIHEELNKICQQNGCTMSVLITRFIENQLSLTDSADSFSSSSSLADSAENTLLENQVRSLQTDFSNLQAIVAELRNNPENEQVLSADSAVTQLVTQLAQPGENLRNKPEFQYYQDSQAQASSAELDESAVTHLKRHCNQLEGENEKLQAELEETYEELEEAFQEISYLKGTKCSLEIELIKRDLSYLINSFNHVVERKAIISELEEHKTWVKIACEIYKIRR